MAQKINIEVMIIEGDVVEVVRAQPIATRKEHDDTIHTISLKRAVVTAAQPDERLRRKLVTK